MTSLSKQQFHSVLQGLDRRAKSVPNTRPALDDPAYTQLLAESARFSDRLDDAAALAAYHGLTDAAFRLRQYSCAVNEFITEILLSIMLRDTPIIEITAMREKYGPFDITSSSENNRLRWIHFLGIHALIADTVSLLLRSVSKSLADEVTKEQSSERSGLLDLRAAADYLGYESAGLRKIVNEKRIQFLQNGRGPIRFRLEWLDDFIAANARGPQDIKRAPAQKRNKSRTNTEPKLSFDSSLYLR